MKIVALAGGVGGAKFINGLAQVLSPEDLTVIVNTGDDFEHFGLYICPDLDTICYTLGGIANPLAGWGRSNETWQVISTVQELGGPGWFRLGDRDLATHLERTRLLRQGERLSNIVARFCKAWKINQSVYPMTDDRVRTMVNTDRHGELEFQDYFVRLQCTPNVKGFRFEGSETARPVEGALAAIKEATAVLICPSNPWVSIAPILEIPGIVSEIKSKKVLAISPIIAGETVKGPAAKMYRELGFKPSALTVAEHYQSVVKGFILDKIDVLLEASIARLGMKALVTNTIMKSPADQRQLAGDVLNLIGSI